jgi:FkbM family methyltransferase
VPGVELRNAYELVRGSIVEDVFEYEREHWSHASCADLFRYLVLYKLGGAYCDIDVLPGPDVSATMRSNTPLFGKPNPPVGEVVLEIRFIFAEAEHELLRRLLVQAEGNERHFIRRKGGYAYGRFDSVIQRTGPGMAIGVVTQYTQEQGLRLQSLLANFTRDDTPENDLEHHGPHQIRKSGIKQTVRQRMQKAFAALDPTHPRHFRVDTHDAIIFRDVMRGEYGDLAYADARVLDIGAHIGGFSTLAARSGAKEVHAFEAGKENYKLLVKNCSKLPAVVCHYAAVWRSDVQENLLWHSPQDAQNTGGGAVTKGLSSLPGVGLDQVIDDYGPFDLAKLDCEGSEIPILMTSQKLQQIPILVGEYHPGVHMGKVAEDMFELLKSKGYVLTLNPTSGGYGLFTARR